ncbi:hypothetical protein R3W88_024026 [Solanum pinnatisectum]|uniref:Uncharacterized protein n=1 Tax=Solanum pinnatisectum TaxID=50273 RepID=A0AAV9M036_9SOLN|nr:hypothetical protein R3W88_024026 [Solanum pinnatisectum]
MTEMIQRCCEVCRNLSFDNGGSQANDIIDTGVDDDYQFNVVGPAVISDFGSSQISLTYTDYYSEIRLRYVMGLQAVIQMQCKTLVEKFNVSPLIVGPIWLRLLAHENVLSDEWADNVIHESESQIQGEIELSQPTGSQKTEPHNLLGKRALTIWHKSLSSMIPLPCSLAISFLVCHVAREAILPTDILKWTLEGKLPYFAAFLEIEKQLTPPSRSCPISTILNFHAIAARYLKHLSLPVEKILPQACQLCEWSMPPELYLSDNDSWLPSRVCVMSILIVTMRILYDLNGGKWECITAVENGAGECGFSCNAREYSKDLHSYLLYCKDLVFAGLGPAYDDREEKRIIEDLWDFYQSRKAGKASKDGKTDSHTCNSFHHSGSRHGCSSTPKESENFRDDACKMSRDNGDSNATLRQLKADMKENRFVYIPPRKNVKTKDGYIRYDRKKDGAYLYAVHVDVRTMHVGVLAFEKRLEMLERRIDFCLCKRLFCEFCKETHHILPTAFAEDLVL